MWGKLSTTCSNVLKQPNGEILVAVNHNQLRTMASETVDPIDWSHPPPSWAVLPERHVHSINRCNLSGTRTCNRSMRGNHLAYAATQGIDAYQFIIEKNVWLVSEKNNFHAKFIAWKTFLKTHDTQKTSHCQFTNGKKMKIF